MTKLSRPLHGPLASRSAPNPKQFLQVDPVRRNTLRVEHIAHIDPRADAAGTGDRSHIRQRRRRPSTALFTDQLGNDPHRHSAAQQRIHSQDPARNPYQLGLPAWRKGTQHRGTQDGFNAISDSRGGGHNVRLIFALTGCGKQSRPARFSVQNSGQATHNDAVIYIFTCI